MSKWLDISLVNCVSVYKITGQTLSSQSVHHVLSNPIKTKIYAVSQAQDIENIFEYWIVSIHHSFIL